MATAAKVTMTLTLFAFLAGLSTDSSFPKRTRHTGLVLFTTISALFAVLTLSWTSN